MPRHPARITTAALGPEMLPSPNYDRMCRYIYEFACTRLIVGTVKFAPRERQIIIEFVSDANAYGVERFVNVMSTLLARKDIYTTNTYTQKEHDNTATFTATSTFAAVK